MNRTWHTGTSAADYHAMEGYGSSALRCFSLVGPLEFYARYIAKKKVFKDSDPFRLGRGFHLGMEKPGHWKDSIVRVPTTISEGDYYDFVREKIEGRGGKAAIPKPGEKLNLKRDFDRAYVQCYRDSAADKGCDFLNDDEIVLVEMQIAACWDNPAIAEVLAQPTQPEVPVTLKHGSLTLKALLDVLLTDRSRFLDFKTTRAKNPHEWWRRYLNEGYGFQIALYEIVTGIEEHDMIYVHNEYPVEAQIMSVPKSLITAERDKVERHIEWLDQTLSTCDLSAVDSQGIPLEFHNEPWGAVIDPEEMFLGGQMRFEGAEEIDAEELEATHGQ